MWLLQKVKRVFFHTQVKKIRIRGLDFCQKFENILSPLLGPPNSIGLFFKNQALSVYLHAKKK